MRCRCASPRKRRPALIGLMRAGIRGLSSCCRLTLRIISKDLPLFEPGSLIHIEDVPGLLRRRRRHSILDIFSPCSLRSSKPFGRFVRESTYPSLHLLSASLFPKAMSFAAPTWPSIFWALSKPLNLIQLRGIIC